METPPPPKKDAPQPTEAEVAIAENFELEMIDEAIKKFKEKQYLSSAMLSWAFVEEFFLPTMLIHIAKNQKIQLETRLIDKAPVGQLIKYYYFISYDRELFDLLLKAKTLRNNLVHELYKSGSMANLELKAKESANYTLETLTPHILDRLKGSVTPPSLNLYAQGWNDMRAKFIAQMDERKAELEKELAELHKKM